MQNLIAGRKRVLWAPRSRRIGRRMSQTQEWRTENERGVSLATHSAEQSTQNERGALKIERGALKMKEERTVRSRAEAAHRAERSGTAQRNRKKRVTDSGGGGFGYAGQCGPGHSTPPRPDLPPLAPTRQLYRYLRKISRRQFMLRLDENFING